MMLPEKQAAWLQAQLYLSTLDEYCPDSFTNGHICDPSLSENNRWGLAVAAIRNCLLSGLLVISSSEWMQAKGLNTPMDLVAALARYNPFISVSQDDEGAAYWLEPLLCGSSQCKDLIHKHGISNYQQCEASPAFAKELEAIFDSHGLAW